METLVLNKSLPRGPSLAPQSVSAYYFTNVSFAILGAHNLALRLLMAVARGSEKSGMRRQLIELAPS
jgi:hypothetical protein